MRGRIIRSDVNTAKNERSTGEGERERNCCEYKKLEKTMKEEGGREGG